MKRLVSDIAIERKKINDFHVFTSPDVLGLFVAIRDDTDYVRKIQSALDMIDRMEERIKNRNNG